MPHVYTIDLRGLPQTPAPWLAVLSADERHQSERFRLPADRIGYAAAHALTRLALADGRRPQSLEFMVNDYGKPSLSGSAPPFNLSHTDGMAAVAVGVNGPVGVDVEKIKPTLATPELAADIFTQEEAAHLRQQADFAEAFTQLWTAKEAVIKAEGQGLALHLPDIIIRQHHAIGPSGPWQLWRSRPTPDHLLTLAWNEDENAVTHQILTAAELTAWAERAK